MRQAFVLCLISMLLSSTSLLPATRKSSGPTQTQSAFVINNRVFLKEKPQEITLFSGYKVLQLIFQDRTEVLDVKPLIQAARRYEAWDVKKFPCLSSWGAVYSAYCFHLKENYYAIIIIKTTDFPDYIMYSQI